MAKYDTVYVGLWQSCVKTTYQDAWPTAIETHRCYSTNNIFILDRIPVNNELLATKVLASISTSSVIVLSIISMMVMAGMIAEKWIKSLSFAVFAAFLCELITIHLFLAFYRNDFRNRILEILKVHEITIMISLGWQFIFGWMFGTVLTLLNANILIRFSKDKESSKALPLSNNKHGSVGEV